MNAKAFGQNVYRLRMALKMTQERFAEKADISRTYLQSIEAGKANPTRMVLDRIKKTCRCGWEELLG